MLLRINITVITSRANGLTTTMHPPTGTDGGIKESQETGIWGPRRAVANPRTVTSPGETHGATKSIQFAEFEFEF
jgi:hypothetical protein